MRGLWPNLHPVVAVVAFVAAIAALVFWIMGGAPRLP
jgi:hypothetical protein